MKAILDGIEEELFKTRGWNPATCKRPCVKAHGLAAASHQSHFDPQLRAHSVIAKTTQMIVNIAGTQASACA